MHAHIQQVIVKSALPFRPRSTRRSGVGAGPELASHARLACQGAGGGLRPPFVGRKAETIAIQHSPLLCVLCLLTLVVVAAAWPGTAGDGPCPLCGTGCVMPGSVQAQRLKKSDMEETGPFVPLVTTAWASRCCGLCGMDTSLTRVDV
jgi:hypothetical protein